MSFIKLVSIITLIIGCLGFLATKGCGFRPIHRTDSVSGMANLGKIDVWIIPNRTGQLLRNELLQQLQPSGPIKPLEYVLSISLDESIQTFAIRRDAVATRANLTLQASFKLKVHHTDKILFTGQSFSINSYNILTSDYATVSARQHARKRAVRHLAMDIRNRVSVWLIQTNPN